MTMLVPDDELIEQIRFKNDLALDLLLTRYEGFINSWVEKIFLKKKDHLEREDMLQIARITLWDCLNCYQANKGNFYAYSKRCVRNALVAHYQNYLQQTSFISLDDDKTRFLAETSPKFTLDNQPKNQETKEMLAKLLTNKKMGSIEREILKYRLLGYSYKDIAQILGITVKKVDNLLVKIKKLARYPKVK